MSMHTLTLLTSNRPVPAQLSGYLDRRVKRWHSLSQERWSAGQSDVILLLSPSFYHNRYLSTEVIWKKFLSLQAPATIFITAGLQSAAGPNHLDLLALPPDWDDFMARALPADRAYPLTLSGGVDTHDKLRRFFAGHGNDSVSEVLARIRRTLRVAAGELAHAGADFAEIQRELIQPARLPGKWAEWQTRWRHYEPLLSGLPFSEQLRQAVHRLEQLTPWMQADCRDQNPLVSGEALAIIDGVKRELNDLESRYVQ